MVIEKALGLPVHGSYSVYGLNKFDRKYLKKRKISDCSSLKIHTKHMNAYTATPNSATSISF